jgi:hypothetical protein
METKDNHLDELIRSTLKEESPGDNASLWNHIDKTLKYKGFLRFSFSSFNIYYSVVLLTTMVSSAYFIWNNNSENDTTVNKNIEKNISNSQQNLDSEKTTYNNTSILPDQNQEPKQYENIVLSEQNSNKINDVKTVKNFPDSTDSITTQKVKKVKIIKKQVLITDTVRKRDTIYIKR